MNCGGNVLRAAGQDAVVIEVKSGLPVTHSGPAPDAANRPTTTGRKPEALLSSTGSRRSFIQAVPPIPIRPKVGGGVGGRAPDGSASLVKQSVTVTRPDSALAPVELEELTLGKYCGSWTLRGREPDSSQRFHRLHCKGWKCSRCGPKKAKHYRHAIGAEAERLKLCRFMTLTLDPKKIHGDPVKYMRKCFAKMRVALLRKFGRTPQYICVLEFHKSGLPHLHFLISRYIDWKWLSAAWQAVGGGWKVDISKVADLHRVRNYVSKYLSKDLLLSAPKRSRRVTTSQGIRLNEKRPPSTATWKLERRSVEGFFEDCAAEVVATVWDGETLEGFSTGPPIKTAIGSNFNLFDQEAA
jgi:hypothetical protein